MYKTLTATGVKAHQRMDTEGRSLEYRMWHRTLAGDLLAADIDLVEWGFVNGILKAVAVCKITRVDSDVPVTHNYPRSIMKRYTERDLQARVIRTVARELSTNAYIILYRQGCEEFWVYNLSQMKGWWHLTREKYEQWLEGVGRK